MGRAASTEQSGDRVIDRATVIPAAPAGMLEPAHRALPVIGGARRRGLVAVLVALAVVLAACSGGEVLVRTQTVGEPVRYEGIVSVARGAPVAVGDSCEIIVEALLRSHRCLPLVRRLMR